MSSSEDFYDPIVAIYDSGVDYLTREKHRKNIDWYLLQRVDGIPCFNYH